MSVFAVEHDGSFRRDGVERRFGWKRRRDPIEMIPPAADDPIAGLGVCCARGDARDGFFQRSRTVEIDARKTRRIRGKMDMMIDQTRNHRAPAHIDCFRSRAAHRQRIVVERGDASVRKRDRVRA